MIFPIDEIDRYYVLSRKHWEALEEVFSGYPIKRVFVYDFRNKQLSGGDSLIKTMI